MRVVAHLFLFGALLAAGAASAATPRGAASREEAKEDPAEAVDPTTWSKRLLGKYTFDGVIRHEEIIDFSARDDVAGEDEVVRGASLYLPEWSQPIEGKGDCIDFAEGPGLQCVINVVWPQMWRDATGKPQLGGVSDLTPAMVLAGFVTSTPGGIKVLLVNDKGLAHPGALTLKGDVASAKPPCVNLPGSQVCDQRFTVTAKADAAVNFVVLSIRVRFVRSKYERKINLEMVNPGTPREHMEKSTEWVEELLEVSFGLRRASPDTEPVSLPPRR